MKRLLLTLSTLQFALGVSGQYQGLDMPYRDINTGSPYLNLNKQPGYTGVIDVSVPIYTIEVDNVKIPINLVYDPNLIKVDNAASWVGYGWALEMPIAVFRKMNFLPDDLMSTRNDCGDGRTTREGFIVGGYTGPQNFDDYSSFPNPGYISAQLSSLRGMSNCSLAGWGIPDYQNGKDGEPDGFFYRLLDKKGSLVAYQGAFKTIPYETLKVTPIYDNNSGWYYNHTKGMVGLEIIDDNGTKYQLDQKDSVRVYSATDNPTTPCLSTNLSGYGGPANVINSIHYNKWQPSRITTKNGRIVLFTYDVETTTENGKQIMAREVGAVSGINYSAKTFRDQYISFKKRITTIETDFERVEFITSHSRQDIFGSYALTEVRIYKKDGGNAVLYKKFVFAYDYFNTSNDNYYLPASSVIDPYKRLKLLSVQEFSANNTSLPSTTFEYNEQMQLPCRYSIEQDFWGYFNNNNATYDYSYNAGGLFPKLYVYPNKLGTNRISVYRRNDWVNNGETEIVLPGANKEPNPSAITTGTLKKIFFPTGGYRQLEFECNTFMLGNELRLGNGLRIKKDSYYDNVSSALLTTEYEYDSSNHSFGVLIDMPHFGFTENECGGNTGYAPDHYQVGSFDYFNHFLWRFLKPIANTGVDIENYTGYRRIKVKRTLQGRTEYYYDIPGIFGETSLTEQRYIDNGLNTLFGVPAATIMKGIDPVLGLWLGQPYLAGLDWGQYSYWAGPRTNFGWARGTVCSIKYFNDANQLVKEEDYRYSVFAGDNQSSFDINCLKFNQIGFFNLADINGTPYFFSIYLNWAYSKYKQIANVRMVPSEKNVTEYLNGIAHYTHTSYVYSGKDPYPTSIEIENSDGSKVKTNYVYPRSFAVGNGTQTSEATAVKALVTNNIISDPIETYTQVQNPGNINYNTIGGKYFEYKALSGNTIPTLHKIWQLENAPVTGFNAAQAVNNSGSWSIAKNSNYKLAGTVNSAISYNRIRESENITGNKTTTLWAYEKKVPVAIVQNAGFDEVAYTSFEDDNEKGGWNYYYNPGSGGDPTIAEDPSNSITGKRIYIMTPYTPQPISRAGLDPSKKYTLSLWYRDSAPIVSGVISAKTGLQTRGWTYKEYIISGVSQVNITAPNDLYLDELRLYPINASMASTTYDIATGHIIDQCDERSNIIYHAYDEFGNLRLIQDINKNIVKKIKTVINGTDN